MKTIGMLSGMSWESTSVYYRMINEATKRALGGFHSAPIAMVSVDFAEIEELQQRGDWTASADLLSANALQIEAAGAELLLICTNTMHKVADEIAAAVKIPLLHIADATASRIIAAGHSKVGLLGTRFTIKEKFYSGRLEKLGLEVLTPNEADRILIHRVIYEELCMGEIRDESRRDFVSIIDRLSDAGAECVVEGCTEITMLVGPDDVRVPLFDTTAIHAEEAVSMALQ